jgi:predicted molibdopterin-dependent oxidoreductase YjgC
MDVKIIIDGLEVFVDDKHTVLEAARSVGIVIPTLCYHKRLSPVGSCRLCSVEVEGMPGIQMACTLQIRDGMVVTTKSPALSKARRGILELLLVNYYDDGYAANNRDETEFMHWVKEYNAEKPVFSIDGPRTEIDSDDNPVVWVDMNKCILCTRCVRVCTEIQGSRVWGVSERGAQAKIVPGANTSMIDARCESCGLCVQVCPTGALDDRISIGKGIADRIVRTTCTYCGVGCQLDLHIKDNKIIRVNVGEEGATNGIALCVKGRYGYDFVDHKDRLTKPMVRQYLLDGGNRKKEAERGEWVEVDWDTALDIVVEKFVDIKQESGSDAIGFLSSAKCTNEENYLVQKFARQVIGTHSVDHCARL